MCNAVHDDGKVTQLFENVDRCFTYHFSMFCAYDVVRRAGGADGPVRDVKPRAKKTAIHSRSGLGETALPVSRH